MSNKPPKHQTRRGARRDAEDRRRAESLLLAAVAAPAGLWSAEAAEAARTAYAAELRGALEAAVPGTVAWEDPAAANARQAVERAIDALARQELAEGRSGCARRLVLAYLERAGAPLATAEKRALSPRLLEELAAEQAPAGETLVDRAAARIAGGVPVVRRVLPASLRPTRSRDFRALLPEDGANAAYYADLEALWFTDPSPIGSRFSEAASLREVLALAEAQRGSLAGDDRWIVAARGLDVSGWLSHCRYLVVETPGEVGGAVSTQALVVIGPAAHDASAEVVWSAYPALI